MGDNAKPQELKTSELEALSIFSLKSQSKNLFTLLQESGFQSPLLQHFANCERECLSDQKNQEITYTLPHSDRAVFVRREVLRKNVSFYQYNECSDSDRKNMLDNLYTLSGGMDGFHTIRMVDPDFFFALSSAIRRSICRITRLNMCMDFQKNLMSLVSESVKKGRVHSFGAHLIGDGVLNGKY